MPARTQRGNPHPSSVAGEEPSVPDASSASVAVPPEQEAAPEETTTAGDTISAVQDANPPTDEDVKSALSPDSAVDRSTDDSAAPEQLAGKSLAKSFGGASTFAVIDQGVVSLVSFLASVFIGRACGEAELGVYGMAVRSFWLVVGIPNALIWVPYTSRIPRLTGDQRRSYQGSVMIHLMVAALAGAIMLLTMGGVARLALPGRARLLPVCLAMIPFAVLMLLREHLRRIMVAHVDMKSLLWLDLPIGVAQLSLLLGLAYFQRLNAITGLLALGLAGLWCGRWLMLNRAELRLDLRQALTDWRANLQFGRWLLVVAIAWLLGEAACMGMVAEFHGEQAFGRYSAAMTAVMVFNPIVLAARSLSLSFLANSLAEGGIAELRRKTIYGSWFMAIAFGVMLTVFGLVGGRLVGNVFGARFVGLGAVVVSCCWGVYFHVLSLPVEGALSALEDGRSMLVAAVVQCLLIVVCGAPLIWHFGPAGVGYSLAAGMGAATLCRWALFHQRCRHAE